MAADESAAVRADPGSRAFRAAALSAGTLGLLTIGVLAVMITPRRDPGPPLAAEASLARPGATRATAVVSATELPTTIATSLAHSLTIGPVVTAPQATALPAATEPAVTAPVAASEPPTATTAPPTSHPPAPGVVALATPLGGGMALVTARAVEGRVTGDTLPVRLASGRELAAELIAVLGRTVVVAGAEFDAETGHPVANVPFSPDALLTVLLSPPRAVTLDQLATLAAPEGTAVVDADGKLVGLCTWADDGTAALALIDDPASDLSGGWLAPSSTASSSPTTSSRPATATSNP